LDIRPAEVTGNGRHSDYKVQSVIFLKEKWTVKDAKKWLRQNKYKAPKVDRKGKYFYFRQIEPEDVEREGFTEYRTKPLFEFTDFKKKEMENSGIALILVYKK
jgi:hypothetical protein